MPAECAGQVPWGIYGLIRAGDIGEPLSTVEFENQSQPPDHGS